MRPNYKTLNSKKRSPKYWTLEHIHDLWTRSNARQMERDRKFWNCLYETHRILKDGGKSRAYFYNKKNTLCYFEISENSEYGISYSTNIEKLDSRENRLDFFLSNEESMKRGQELFNLQSLTFQKLNRWAYSAFIDVLNNKLNEKFKSDKKIPPKCFLVEIGSKKYFIEKVEGFSYNWNQFKMLNEFEGTTVKFEQTPTDQPSP
jgi:hypothetical protein